MNIDIRLSVGFWQHPKTYRLEKRIGLKGVRSLQILWCWCAQNRPDGDLGDLDAGEIEFVADWRGRKGAFVEACLNCGWIDECDDGFRLHEWAEYNPYQARAGSREEVRKEKARHAANTRWGKKRQKDANGCPGDATSNAQAYAQDDTSICSNDAQAYANGCPGDAPSNAQKMPSLTSTSTREIKESSLRSDSFCAELSGDTSTRDKIGAGSVSQNSPPVIALPLNTGEAYPVTQDMAAKWQELYPAVDVLQQLRNMRGWLDANAARRKTRNGILKFINRWLADKQDNGGNPRASPYIPQWQPTAPTEYQKNMQEHRLMASALLAKRQERKQTEGIDAAIDTVAIRIA